MASRERVGWLTCDEGQCIGIRLRAGSKCLAHAGEEGGSAALEETAQTGKIDARGVTISSTLLKELLDSVPRNSDGREMSADALFDRATFQGDADFNGTIFQGDTEFHGATFQGDAMFFGSTFYGRAQFQEATFQGDAQFDGSTFQDVAKFSRATFERVAVFDGASSRATPYSTG